MSESAEKKIDRLYAVVGKTKDGREGIAAVTSENGTSMPLVGPSSSLPQLREFMKALIGMTGTELVLTEWTGRKNLEVLHPEKT